MAEEVHSADAVDVTRIVLPVVRVVGKVVADEVVIGTVVGPVMTFTHQQPHTRLVTRVDPVDGALDGTRVGAAQPGQRQVGAGIAGRGRAGMWKEGGVGK